MALEIKTLAEPPVSETGPTLSDRGDLESGLRAIAIADERADEASLEALIGDRYVIERPLAEGGMGTVYLGRHVELGQAVAIKLLRSDLCDRTSVVQRFLNEARSAASLKSDNIVRILDVGELRSGRPYIVMEHLEGIDLDALLERDGPLPIQTAVEYTVQVCAALGVAHGQQIIHRDIKPENLFLVSSSRGDLVKVLDFGLAKRIDASPALTGPEDSMGSPFYMSPEQIVTPQKIDLRTDIWSTGVVLYRLLTGSVPFPGDTITEVYARVLNAEPVPPPVLRPEIDAGLEAILLRCMAKDPAGRFATTADLALALEWYLRRRNRPVLSLTPTFEDVDARPRRIPGIHRRWPAALALLAVALGAGTYYERDRASIFLDVDSLRDRATAAVLSIDTIKDLDRRYPIRPRLGELVEPPFRSVAAVSYFVEPRGVVARTESAFDSSGSTIRSVPELSPRSPLDAADEDDLTAVEKERRYRDYLRQNGFVPLRDVLQGRN